MPVGYTKLFNELIMSTVWREPDHVRILWITMLAIKDRWHIANASLPGLADAARITMEQCQEGLEILSAPDPYSRSKEFEGRRIEACEGGWLILNGEKYRNKMSLDERREYNRIKQREYRARDKAVKSYVQSSTESTHTDTDTEAKRTTKRATFVAPSVEEVQTYMAEKGTIDFSEAETFVDFYSSKGWMVGKNKMKDWKAAVRNWLKRKESDGNNDSGHASDWLPGGKFNREGSVRDDEDNVSGTIFERAGRPRKAGDIKLVGNSTQQIQKKPD